jgi:hypothetical protein
MQVIGSRSYLSGLFGDLPCSHCLLDRKSDHIQHDKVIPLVEKICFEMATLAFLRGTSDP